MNAGKLLRPKLSHIGVILLLSGLSISLLLGGVFYYYNRPPVAANAAIIAAPSDVFTFGPLTPTFHAMQAAGVIRSARFALTVAQLLGYSKRIRAGSYRFTNQLSTLEILRLLIKGQEASQLVTIVEGHDLYDIAETLAHLKLIVTAADFITYVYAPATLQAAHKSLLLPPSITSLQSLEGLLAPDTYRVRLSRPKQDLVTLALARFKTELLPVLQQTQTPPANWLKLFTISSLIEKETALTSEKTLIASVLYNRLSRNMKLRYDPTIIYALKHANQYSANLTAAGNIDIKREHFHICFAVQYVYA